MNNVFIVHGWVLDAIRLIFAAIDGIIYELLAAVVAIFYNVASAQLISGTVMHDFFSRIQLVLGIIVMFKVATSLFMGIMNPESLGDKKNGFGSVIKRVIIVLIMLVLIVPLDIPGVDMDDISETGQTSWNARLNANGIAFGTLFELQARLLKQNTIAKLVLGVDGSEATTNETGLESGQNLSRIIFKSFFVIAEYDGEPICETSSGSNLEKAYNLYLDDDSTAGELLSIVNYTCEDGDGTVASIFDAIDFLDLFDSGNFYAFSYSFLFSTVVGIFCVIVMISYTVDAAIRLVKLTILYLIAPIPILSYIDPKTEKNFHNWLKVVGSTYLDLFIRLAIVYIIIFLIREVDSTLFNGTNDFLAVEDGVVGVFSKVFIILGLLMFAREAPKFITDTLGLKQTNGLFGGLTSLIGGVSSSIQGFKASQDSMKNRLDSNGNPINPPEKFRNRAKSVGAGLLTGIGGMSQTYTTYAGAKDNKFRSSLDKINSQNAIRRENAMHGSTFGSALMAQGMQDLTGDSKYDRLKREKQQIEKGIKKKESDLADKKQQAALVSGNAKKMSDIISKAQDTVKKKGAETVFDGKLTNLKDIEAAYEVGKTTGNYTFEGKTYSAADFGKLYSDSIDNAANLYLAGKATFANGASMSISQEHQVLLDQAQTAFTANGGAFSELKDENGNSIAGTTDYIKGFKTEADKLVAEDLTTQADLQTAQNAIDVEKKKLSAKEADLERAKADLRNSDGGRGGK
ncbi:MAG: hypothetical protein IK997_04570 [Bacilli bacterium]|nr:hypothetical protein [Bacilli bacterium]